MNNESQQALSTAISLHSQGRLDEADAIYTQVLAREPRQADAMHLHGVVAHQRGLHTRAVSAISQALVLQPGHPGYLNNLGEAYRSLRQYPQAVSCYQQALEANPKDGNALNNLGMALHQQHRFEESQAAFERAIAAAPGDPEVLTNLGNMLRDQGEHDHAAQCYQQAVEQVPEYAPAHAWLGVTLHELERHDEAIAAMQRAVCLDPLNQEIHANLKRVRWNLNQRKHLHDSYRAACKQLPNSAEAHMNLAQSLLVNGNFAEALVSSQRSVALGAGVARAHSLLGQAQMALGDKLEGIHAHQRAHELAGDDPLVAEEFAAALSLVDKHAGARDVLRDALALAPRRSGILGRLCIALRELQDPSLDELVDYDRFMHSELIEVPSGFSDLAQFNAALHEALKQQHIGANHALEQSMRGGIQTENNLFQNPNGLVALLKQQISKTIDHFIAGLPDNAAHPFLRFKPQQYVYTGAWSTILKQTGYDGSHIHNEGWLSGTYYVEAPNLSDAQHAAEEGYLQFGEPPRVHTSERNYRVRSVAPQVGRVVLFPSYYWHGVRVFHTGGRRHSVSFDVI
jgi:uncharacterized protein (TIGR02466 family)